MSRIQRRDTKPEMVVRRGLHAQGLRFRLHRQDLPGRPDLTLTKYRVVIFVHGCFWHGHNCPMFTWPQTRKKFWREKIRKTQERDQSALNSLKESEWRVLTIWECALKGPNKYSLEDVLRHCENFVLNTVHDEMEILGLPTSIL